MFTDVEGSTRLLDKVGAERYGVLLAEHHRVCRGAWEKHGGVEVDTAGDAFFVAFRRADDAVAAAAAAQDSLSRVGLSVRMGVHSGKVMVAETGYVGLEVHRAARIAAAAHGGQVLVSETTAALLGEGGRVGLCDLGEHRFKDLSAPERVFQLGDEVFPPIRSLFHTNLPVPASSFVGREREVETVTALTREDGTRLLTLTGPGGTGKTRLALQAAAGAADAFPDGVWWVALASLRDPELVLPALAGALDVADDSDRPLAEVLAERLRGRRSLVLLDNAEHLLPALAETVAGLLEVTPTVCYLVTSRERLQVSGERVHAVSELDDVDASALFLARAEGAGVVLEATDDVGELCARLDNLPLALELAAVRTTLFTPEQLLARLRNRLDLLKAGRGVDARQQTLRATIDWSYDLLDEEEQRVLRALSVFVDGCTLEAAESVARTEPDSVQSLLDKSLLRRRAPGAEPRFWMLETIREYAADRCAEEDESDALAAAHADWIEALVVDGAPVSMAMGYGTGQWNDRLREEQANLRAALTVLAERDPARLARLVGVVWPWWYFAGALREALRWLEVSLAVVDGTPAAIPVHSGISNVAFRMGDDTRAGEHAAAALALARAGGTGLQVAEALRDLGNASLTRDPERAAELYEESAEVARAIGDKACLGAAAANLGYLALRRGDWAEGAARSAEAAAVAREAGIEYLLQLTVFNQGLACTGAGDLAQALPLYVESLRSGLDRRFPEGIVYPLEGIAIVLSADGEHERAARAIGASAAMREATEQSFEEPHRSFVEDAVRRSRAALGPAWDVLEAEGRASRAEDVAEALLGELATDA